MEFFRQFRCERKRFHENGFFLEQFLSPEMQSEFMIPSIGINKKSRTLDPLSLHDLNDDLNDGLNDLMI